MIPIQRYRLPSDRHEAIDAKYKIKSFVDREKPTKFRPTLLVPPWDAIRSMIDRFRALDDDYLGEELSDDAGLLVEQVVGLLRRDQVIGIYIREEWNDYTTDKETWDLIYEVYAHRLIARYHREIAAEESDDD